jgi:predicted RNase H-like HicB family nuclease
MDLTIKLHDCSVDGETGFGAVCAEFPEANGQGETREQCLADLRSSIEEILAYRREEAQKSVVPGERLETLPA